MFLIYRNKSEYHEDPFIYLSSSLPPKYAHGLASFITEVIQIIN